MATRYYTGATTGIDTHRRRTRRPGGAPSPYVAPAPSPRYTGATTGIGPRRGTTAAPSTGGTRARSGRTTTPLTPSRGRGATLSRVLAGLTPEQRALAPHAIAAARKTGVPASVLLSLTGQESDYGTNLGPSSAGARGETQFIPGTRDKMVADYGVDPWAGPREALLAAGLYLKELGFKQDPNAALSFYSGGYAESEYNNPILTNARNFKALDKLAGAKVKMPRALSTNELYHDPGINLSDGQPTGAIGNHGQHVHYASENPRSLLRAARIAQRHGGLLGENPAFGDRVVEPRPTHSDTSYHYRNMRIPGRLMGLARKAGAQGRTLGEALDITAPGNDPEILMDINQALARRSGSSVLPAAGSTPVGGSSSIGGYGASAGFGATVPSRGQRPTGRSSSGGSAPTRSALSARAVLPAAFRNLPGGLGEGDEVAPEDILSELAGVQGRSKPRKRLMVG